MQRGTHLLFGLAALASAHVAAATEEATAGDWRQPPLVLYSHESAVLAVSLSADGRIALSGGSDFTVRVWDAATGNILHAMEGHTGYVDAVLLSANGCIAMSLAGYRTLRLWNAGTGEPLRVMGSRVGVEGMGA